MGAMELVKKVVREVKAGEVGAVDLVRRVLARGHGPKDALEVLKKDHEVIASLFDKLQTMGERSGDTREGLFSQLKYELETHTAVEERIFYPALEKAAAGKAPKEDVLQAVEAHRLIKQLLGELAAMPQDRPEWAATLKVLRENVEAHVRDEEHDLFPQARRVLGREKLQKMGARIEAEKKGPSGETAPQAEAAAPGEQPAPGPSH